MRYTYSERQLDNYSQH